MEQRKLPKYSIFLMILTVISAIGGFYLIQYGKDMKAKRVLEKLGYKNIIYVKTYKRENVEDYKTKTRGFKFAVKFRYDNKECRGFLFRDYKWNVKQDVECKDVK